MSWFYRCTSRLFRLFFRSFYNFKMIHLGEIPNGAALIAPNHASFLDPPLIAAAWPKEAHFLARSSLFKGFLWSKLLFALNAHPITGSPHDLFTFKYICTLLKEGKSVVLFPEGARTDDGNFNEIKTGIAMLAIRTDSPIIPVYINGTFDAWPRHAKWPSFNKTITCIFGKPIFPASAEGKAKKERQLLLTRQLELAMKELQLLYQNNFLG